MSVLGCISLATYFPLGCSCCFIGFLPIETARSLVILYVVYRDVITVVLHTSVSHYCYLCSIVFMANSAWLHMFDICKGFFHVIFYNTNDKFNAFA